MRQCLIQDFVTHTPEMLPVSEVDRYSSLSYIVVMYL
jgi:hypothetical protein